jgi:hypothetical protein
MPASDAPLGDCAILTGAGIGGIGGMGCATAEKVVSQAIRKTINAKAASKSQVGQVVSLI